MVALLTLVALGGANCGGRERPGDLIPHARISADGIRIYAPWPWPREDEHGPATVRDGHPDTAWQAPVATTSRLEIDLQPWLGRQVALERMRLTMAGASPRDLRLLLSPACGQPPKHELIWTDPAAPLVLKGRKAGCIELEVQTGPEGFGLAGLELLGRDPGRPPAPETADLSPPAHPHSGIIEGFYGVPWSWAEREQMLIGLAAAGLGSYLYAPKHDPHHRDLWRQAYPEEDLLRFGALATTAGALGLHLVVGISPFQDFDFGAGLERDYALLLAKAEALAEQGIAGLALLADDIEFALEQPVDGALGQQHVDLVNRLRDEVVQDHPQLLLWFVPTVYSDERLDAFEQGEAYLSALAGLHQGVSVMWTGSHTSSATMEAADMDRVRELTGRRPILWDNFWANDGGDGFQGRLLLAPLTGRSGDLAGAVAGQAFNPLIQGSLSRLVLACAAESIRESGLVDPSAARERAARAETRFCLGHKGDTRADAALLALIMEAFEGHAQQEAGYARLGQALATLQAGLDELESSGRPPLSEAYELLTLLAQLSVLPGLSHHSGLASGLVDELVFPLQRVAHEATAGMWIITVLEQRLRGAPAEQAASRAEEAFSRANLCRFTWDGSGLRQLQQRVLAMAARPGLLEAVGEGEPLPGGCAAGRAWVWAPFEGAQELVVFGLPGAEVDGADGAGRIRLRFSPPHGGRFDGVVVARSQQGLAWRSFQLLCGGS